MFSWPGIYIAEAPIWMTQECKQVTNAELGLVHYFSYKLLVHSLHFQVWTNTDTAWLYHRYYDTRVVAMGLDVSVSRRTNV